MQTNEAKCFDNDGVMLSGTNVPEAIMLDVNGNELTLKNGNSAFEAKIVENYNSKNQLETTIYGLYHMALNYANPYIVHYPIVIVRG